MPEKSDVTTNPEREQLVVSMADVQASRQLRDALTQQQSDAQEYIEFLRRKVDAGRGSMRAGRGLSNDEMEAEFAARRASAAGIT